ncbi:tetratricopeptide repeat protein [Halomicronema sp. CCY15110]|uniref:tetratricopeptide repeat protein n=1 Tax=Halomicronema sp. CCY15110 TaxID=2767773 RepID=UPI001950831B|nr:tetratricopeptide repeat protein [Halomicronema sp. CCY15110]
MGREADLTRLHDELDTHRRVNIVGMFGLGKTELALQYARAYAADYPGGVAWFGAANFGADLNQWVQAERYPEQDLRHLDLKQQVIKAWKAWQEFCGQRPALVIVDDVTDYRQQVAPYLPPNDEVAAPFRLIFTSRSQVAHLEPFRLPQLTPAAARQLLERLAGTKRIEAAVATAEAIGQRLGYLPLALTLVGSWLNVDPDRTVDYLQQALDDKGLDAPPLERDPDDVITAERGVQAAFAISWDDLQRRSTDGAQLARVLTLFAPVDLPWDLIAVVVATYDQEYGVPARSAPVVRPEPTGWRKLWQRFWRGLCQLFGRTSESTRPAPIPVYPVNDPVEARGQLLRLSLLERVRSEAAESDSEAAISPAVATPLAKGSRGGSAYRLHPLLRDLFAAQWPGFGREQWELAWALGMAAQAAQVPQTVDVETARQFDDLKAQLAPAEVTLTQAQKATAATLPSVSERYKVAARQIKVATFRLSQRVMLATRFDQAQKIYDEAKATAGAGNQVIASRKFGEAIAAYQQVVADARHTLPPHSLELAGYLNRLARIFRELGQYTQGIPLAAEAVQIAETRQINPVTLGSYLNDLGSLYHFQGNYGEAEPLFQRSLQIWEQQLGADHPHVASSLNNLAGLYRAQGRYGEAEPLYQRSLRIWEEQLGADHPNVATSLNNLALLYESQGRYGEAEPLYRRSLQIWEQQLGADHPNVALSLNNLAGLYEKQGRYGEAEPLHRRSLQIWEQQLGADHPDVATSLNNLAELYRAQGRDGEAEPLYRRSLQIKEQQLGADHPDVANSLNNLAGLYYAQGRYGEAEPLYLRAIEIWVKALPAGHPYIATGQNNFAGMIRAALAAGQADQLSNHPTTQAILQQLRNDT